MGDIPKRPLDPFLAQSDYVCLLIPEEVGGNRGFTVVPYGVKRVDDGEKTFFKTVADLDRTAATAGMISRTEYLCLVMLWHLTPS